MTNKILESYIPPIILAVTLVIGSAGCSLFDHNEADPMFKSLTPEETGISFSNEISYNEDFSVMDFSYLYNGGGVAVGDINNDGLPDIYLTGNRVSSRLYLNKGNFKFEDITDLSGTTTNQWAGGVSMVDINNDGFLDIYVAITGTEDSTPEERTNLLFVNNQDSTFTEAAAQYGLADSGFTTHSAFFDYDRDGDLDVFLMNNFAGSFSRDNKSGLRAEINDGTSKSTDALYRNNGDGTFSDVSQNAGILKEGYSLGIAISDINRDGWPDIYVSNDVQTDDLLYINNRDGTFTDRAAQYFKHTSYAGMGTDVADFNNDGWPDVVQVDMMPPSLEDQQLVTGVRDYNYLKELEAKGYQSQYSLNTLQMSNGIDDQGDVIFSEVARLAGVAYTDWSWSALFGDYDNDGQKDIMITNGYPKAVNSFDYFRELVGLSMFGTDSTRKKREYEVMDDLYALKMPNYFYKNRGDLTFSDVSKEWGFMESSFSYGAAHADLDGDGDLDIIVNNINDAADVYENTADSVKNKHYLSIRLKGDSLNINGIGSKVILSVNGETQYSYFSPYRGYQSSMDHKVHFGLGNHQEVDSLEVIWPDGRYQLIEDVDSDQVFTLDYKEAESRARGNKKELGASQPLFVNAADELNIDYKHTENEYVDFNKEPLLPNMLSRLGPPVAVGDVNNDQRDDFYIGGAAGSAGVLFIQQADGTFEKSLESKVWMDDQNFEDTGAVFFDANGDGFLDLYVVSGGNEFSPASAQLQDRLYLNSGDGQFVRDEYRLPRMYTSGSVVKPADYDNDGDTDLFVGGRLVPGQYPMPAKSYILRNDNGSFTDVTGEVAADLAEPGLITDAEWVDFDGDGLTDLVTTGIWMPVSFFKNKDGVFENITPSSGISQNVGWWYSIEKGDIDGDGDLDFIVGNLGLNHTYSAPTHPPLDVFVHDFDGNQNLDAIFAMQRDGLNYSLHGMRSMREQLPSPLRRIQSFRAYSRASLETLFGAETMEQAMHYQANNFSSSVVINRGDGLFEMKALPNEAQISPIKDILITDINSDNNPDLIIAGNIFNSSPQIPRSDAGNGLVLVGDGTGSFKSISPYKSGFLTPFEARNLALVATENGPVVLVTNNDDVLQVFKVERSTKFKFISK